MKRRTRPKAVRISIRVEIVRLVKVKRMYADEMANLKGYGATIGGIKGTKNS